MRRPAHAARRSAWRAAGRAACALAGLAASACIAVPAAQARSPAGECRAAGNDDTLRPLPPALVPAARRAFGLSMPADMVMRMTVWRCLDGAVLMCTEGANLPCGKADTARALPGATAWCHQHPGAAVVPMVATGHDTIYDWRCHDTVAVPHGAPRAVDSRGFIADVWKPLCPTCRDKAAPMAPPVPTAPVATTPVPRTPVP